MSVKNLIVIGLLLTGFMAQGQESFTLQQAIDYSMKNSNSLKLKQIEIADAEANIKELRSAGFPKVTGAVAYQYYPAIPRTPVEDFISPIVIGVLNGAGFLPEPIVPGPLEVFEFSFVQRNSLSATIDAQWLIFDGSYLAALKAAKLFRSFVLDGVAISEQEIRNNVTKAYMNVLILDINKSTIENNITNLEKTLFEISALYKEGFVEKLDVDRVQLSLLSLQTELDKLEQVENLSKNLLKFQMDYPLEQEINLSESLQELIDLSMIEKVDLNEEIDFNKRAEYGQIQKGLGLQEINIERIQKTNWPSLVGFGNFGESLQRNNLFDNEQAGWLAQSAIGLNLSVPIYDGGLRKAQIERAKLDNEKALLELDNFEKGISLQVANAKIQYLNAKSSLESVERTLALTEEIFEKTQIKFREGVGSSIEVTQAQTSLYDVQSQKITALYNLLNAKTDLQIALGEL